MANSEIIILEVLIVVVPILLWVGLILQQARYYQQIKLMALYLHRATHMLRDSFYHLALLKNRNLLKYNDILNECSSISTRLVDIIQSLLSNYVREDVYVCLKLVNPPTGFYLSKENDTENSSVYTFCRSSNTPIERYHSDAIPVPVINNTAFRMILLDEADSFAVSDLMKYDKQIRNGGDARGYQNTTERWDRFYRSTIVVPIRIRAELLGIGDSGYDLLGFLCADCKVAGGFPKNRLTALVNMLMCFADMFYPYLERISSYNKDISG